MAAMSTEDEDQSFDNMRYLPEIQEMAESMIANGTSEDLDSLVRELHIGTLQNLKNGNFKRAISFPTDAVNAMSIDGNQVINAYIVPDFFEVVLVVQYWSALTGDFQFFQTAIDNEKIGGMACRIDSVLLKGSQVFCQIQNRQPVDKCFIVLEMNHKTKKMKTLWLKVSRGSDKVETLMLTATHCVIWVHRKYPGLPVVETFHIRNGKRMFYYPFTCQLPDSSFGPVVNDNWLILSIITTEDVAQLHAFNTLDKYLTVLPMPGRPRGFRNSKLAIANDHLAGLDWGRIHIWNLPAGQLVKTIDLVPGAISKATSRFFTKLVHFAPAEGEIDVVMCTLPAAEINVIIKIRGENQSEQEVPGKMPKLFFLDHAISVEMPALNSTRKVKIAAIGSKTNPSFEVLKNHPNKEPVIVTPTLMAVSINKTRIEILDFLNRGCYKKKMLPSSSMDTDE